MMQKTIKIAPSLLSANFACLGEEIQRLEKAGADLIHFDVMDGHYVPNITIGPDVMKSLRSYTSLKFDVHLMIQPADPYLAAFRQAGADIITLHPDATIHLQRSLSLIRSLGAKAGVALNPHTPLSVLEWVLEDVDVVLVMSVNPGFGGQSFLPSSLEKIKQLKAMIGARPIEIEVDGGVNPETAPLLKEAGAQILVAGTAVFNTLDYKANIEGLR